MLSNRFSKEFKVFAKLFGRENSKEANNVESSVQNILSQIEKIGIYSLSKTYKDALLWAHYANSHKGFCIEYNLEELLQNYPHNFDVKYNNYVPQIGLKDIAIKSRRQNIIKKAFGYKYKKWAYEEEYRIITNDYGINHYDYKAVKSIYFGLRMDDTQKTEIMNRLKGRGIKYYQIERLNDSYDFASNPVQDINSTETTYLKQIPSEITGNIPIKFDITKKQYWAVKGKGNIEIELERVVSKEELMWLARTIKENLFLDSNMVIMLYYIKNKDKGIAWATTHYQNGKINLNINGLLED